MLIDPTASERLFRAQLSMYIAGKKRVSKRSAVVILMEYIAFIKISCGYTSALDTVNEYYRVTLVLARSKV